MRQSCVLTIVAIFATAAQAPAAMLRGGGSVSTDCALVFAVPGANNPAPPGIPKGVDCIDGDPACDEDGLRNGECAFSIQACVNSTAVTDCTPDSVDTSVVDHAIDDGEDRRFDVDFQALQLRINTLGLPTSSPDYCTVNSTITVKLRGPDSSNVMKINKKIVKVTTEGFTADGAARDKDKVKFTCRPEGDRIYLPTALYTGTFDRIRDQVFAQGCAISGCHDSEGNEGDLILLPDSAYGNLINVTPNNLAAAGDMLKRVTPGDPAMSFLYRKLTNDLEAGYGDAMPLEGADIDPALIEIIRLWIIGDGIVDPASDEGWVVGTDQ